MPLPRTNYLTDLQGTPGATATFDSSVLADQPAFLPSVPAQQETEQAFFDLGDTIVSIGRGVGYAFHGAYDLVDTLGFDVLPDWDPEKAFGKASSQVGSIVTGISQFAAGFLLTGGLIGKAIGGLGTIAQGAIKGAVTDFAFFDGHERRLSNLIQETDLANPVSEFLAADEDDPELVARMKNVAEGAGLGAIFDAFFVGLRKFKAGSRVKADGGTPEAVAKAMDDVDGPDAVDQALADVAIPVEKETVSDEAVVEVFRRLGASDVQNIKDARSILGDRIGAETLASSPTTGLNRAEPDVPLTRAQLEAQGIARNDLNLFRVKDPDGAVVTQRAIAQVYYDDIINAAPESLAEMRDRGIAALTEYLGVTADQAATLIQRRLAGLSGNKDALRRITAETLADKSILETLTRNYSQAIDAAGDLNALSDEGIAELVRNLETVATFTKGVKGVLREQGRMLVSNRTFNFPLKAVDPVADTVEAAAKNEDVAETIIRAGGSSDVTKARKRIITQLRAAKDAADNNGVVGLVNGAQVFERGRTWDVVTEYWINSILSGPKTLTINLFSNTFAALYRPLETGLGGLITLNGDAVRQSMYEMGALLEGFRDIFRLGNSKTREHVVSAFKSGDGVLFNQLGESGRRGRFRAGPAITGQNLREGWLGSAAGLIFRSAGGGEQLGQTLSNAASRAADVGGGIIRTPTRILQSTDEFFKQINARATMRADLMRTGRSRGLTGSQLGEFVRDGEHTLIQQGQMLSRAQLAGEAVDEARASLARQGIADEGAIQQVAEHTYRQKIDDLSERFGDFDQILDRAAGRAQEATFTQFAEGTAIDTAGKAIQSLTRAVPFLKLAVPFVQTPVNILKFAYRRTPADAVLSSLQYASAKLRNVPWEATKAAQNKLIKELSSPDAVVKADAAGRVAMGVGMAATMYQLASNMFNPDATVSITGRLSDDPDEKAAMMKAGIQPYSFKIGDTYISYQRLDPFASVFGTVADMTQYAHFDPDEEAEGMSWAFVTALAKNFTNKSYLQGLENAMTVLMGREPHKIARIMRQYAGSFVPNVSAQINQAVDDGEMKEIRSAVEAGMARLPFYSRDVEARRDPLGAPVERTVNWSEDTWQAWMSRWTPFPTTQLRDDNVAQEMMRTGEGWRGIKRKTQLGGEQVDLTDFRSESGQTALDRYRELSGQVEIGGRNLRKALSDLIESPQYQALVDTGTEAALEQRTNLFRGFITAYRSVAKQKMLEEYPEIIQFVRQTQQNKGINL